MKLYAIRKIIRGSAFPGAIFLLMLASTLTARAASLGPVTSVTPSGSYVEIEFAGGKARVSMRGDGLLRVRAAQSSFDDTPSFAVLPGADQAPAMAEDDNYILLKTGLLEFAVNRETGTMDVRDGAGNALFSEPAGGGVFFDGGRVGCVKAMPADEHYYGFGEKTGPLDKRGERMRMWNWDMPYNTAQDPMYQSHPFFMTLRGGRAAGLFFDNTFRTEFDMGASEKDEYSFAADGGEVNYWVIAGPAPADVLSRYGELVGTMPMPPLWGIGYHQCRWSYENERRVREVRGGFVANNIPLDAIYLDIHYMDGYRVFTFDPRRFPDPAGLAAELKRDGVHLVVIVDPGVKIDPGYSIYDQGLQKKYFFVDGRGEPFVAYVWPGACNFPDFIRPEVKKWWGGLFDFYTGKGVDGFWLDMNEPAGSGKNFELAGLSIPLKKIDWLAARHGSAPDLVPHARIRNVYALNQAEATYDGLLKLRPNQRPFIISRAGYSGLSRYSLVWTGDNFSTWGSMRVSLPMLMNMGMSGMTFVGADIGGFTGAPSKELYARWIELGSFYPFSRTHTAVNMPDQEPWSFGDEVTDIAREYIKLRYRLLPYTYSYFEESHRTNWPVMRPLVFSYPDDPAVAEIADEFLWGDWLLVAPVVENGRKEREVYFPAGDWYSWDTKEKFMGPGRQVVDAPMGKLPLFAKAGAIIPLAPEMTHTGEKPWSPLTVLVFPDGDETSFTLYEDDGKSLDYQSGAFARTTFHRRPLPGGAEIVIDHREGPYDPGPKVIELRVFGLGPDVTVAMTGPDGAPVAAPQAAYDQTTSAWLIQFDYDGSQRTIRIEGK